MSETKEYLATLDSEHNPAEVEDMGFGNFPNSKYQVRLDKIYITKSKNGRVQCVIELEILNGSLAHRTIYKYSGMETEQNLDFLTRDLRVLGVPVNFKWGSVTEHFPSLLDNLYEVELKTKGDFQNVYILKKLNQDNVLQVKETTPEDDVPF